MQVFWREYSYGILELWILWIATEILKVYSNVSLDEMTFLSYFRNRFFIVLLMNINHRTKLDLFKSAAR